MDKYIALLCNPTADNAKSLRMAEELGRYLQIRAIPFKVFSDSWPDTLENFTDAWIIGGDGTLNWFINTYPDTTLTLSVFPAGSGNDFHWMLYDNLRPLQQLEAILSGQTRWIDAGTCNGRLFINGVGIGFDGAIVKDLIGKKKVAGKASYLLAIMKNILRYHEAECRITMNGKTIKEQSFMLSVANGKRYGGGFYVAPKAATDDGLLDINRVGPISPLKRMRYLPVIEKGGHLELPFIQYSQSAKVVIEAATELPAHLDGEYLQASVFTIDCLPKKFRFSV
ncbi:MAG: hypothetical protein JWP88_316 [Flaviaesturariibacter sp.]|nr:hypothetical protein [Flaviaesturariibacter sp.]